MRMIVAAIAIMVGGMAGAAAQTPAGRLSTVESVGAPAAGANSFTENQARARIEMRGFSEVGPLVKNGDGVWQGAATKDGKKMHVSLDFKGDVTAD